MQEGYEPLITLAGAQPDSSQQEELEGHERSCMLADDFKQGTLQAIA